MSVWSRLKDAVVGPPTPEPASPPPPRPAPSAPIPKTAAEELASFGSAPTDTEAKEIALLERATADGLEADALDHARRILGRTSMPTFALRVAERLDARGDDEGASIVLAPLLDTKTDAPLDAWMLAAEIAERRGDVVRALASYERVVARDFAYPRARERALRLSETIRGERDVDAGATLMGAGAAQRRFRVLRELGRGGAGTVFLAEDVALGREVALKIYQRRGRADRMRMLHEARVPALLVHRSVVRVLDVDESVLGIAMELAPRGSLRAEITRAPIALDRVAAITSRIASALVHVRASGWVHRDVKPSNLLLREDDGIVLTDFGIAAKIGAPGVAGEGSMGFMPAEQRAGAEAATSMDVHALGATMLEMLEPHGAASGGDGLEALRSLAHAAMRADPRARPPLERFVEIK